MNPSSGSPGNSQTALPDQELTENTNFIIETMCEHLLLDKTGQNLD